MSRRWLGAPGGECGLPNAGVDPDTGSHDRESYNDWKTMTSVTAEVIISSIVSLYE